MEEDKGATNRLLPVEDKNELKLKQKQKQEERRRTNELDSNIHGS